MQYGLVLYCLLQETIFADPSKVPVYILKAYVSGGFYWICLHPSNSSKLGLIFPLNDEDEPLVAVTLTVPIGWNNSAPLFFTGT